MAREKKSAEESQIQTVRHMLPGDGNPLGTVFGGRVLYLIDEVASMVARKHARSNCVTASIHKMSFEAPVHIGDALHLHGRMVYVGKTSMTVRVKVETEDLASGERRDAGTAWLTFVGVDKKGNPKRVPGLELEDDEARALWAEAEEIRRWR